MPTQDDELTPDEIAAFEAADDETRKRIEKYNKWHAQKSQQPPQKPGSTPSSDDPLARLSLADLSRLTADPLTRSTLEHLLKNPLQSPDRGKNESGGGRPGAGEKKGLRLL